MMTEKILITWSGGKDNTLALHEIKQNNDFEIISLLTTLTMDYNRINMHGVREELLDNQISSLGYTLEKIQISKNATNEEYDSIMKQVLEKYKAQGIQKVVFGDIFLEDVRKYREQNLAKVGMVGIFPLWGKNSKKLAQKFIKLGYKAIITCVDSQLLDGRFAGRLFNEKFLDDLPPNVDPCGENGEFHTFVFDGPSFKRPILFVPGEVVLKENRFYFCDLKIK